MKIGILSNFIDDVFLKSFPHEYSHISVTTEIYDGFFVDWVPKKQDESKFLTQCALIEIHKNTVPIVIFDRSMSLIPEEVKWLNKYRNVSLLEPAIHPRHGFKYMPVWITDFSVLKNSGDRRYNLTCTFDGLEEDKIKKYKIVFNEDFKEINYIIAVDSPSNYKRGILDSRIFDAMKNGCIPILPIEHRYFNALFNGLIIKSIYDIDIYTSTYHMVNVPIVEEIYFNLKKYYPEFLVDFAISKISECLENK